MKDKKVVTHKRRHYRIVYPKGHRPTLVLDDVKFLIADISERGIKFINDVDRDLPIGKDVDAVIYFHDGITEKVHGKVLRETTSEAVVELHVSLPFDRLSEEYRYVEMRLKKGGKS